AWPTLRPRDFRRLTVERGLGNGLAGHLLSYISHIGGHVALQPSSAPPSRPRLIFCLHTVYPRRGRHPLLICVFARLLFLLQAEAVPPPLPPPTPPAPAPPPPPGGQRPLLVRRSPRRARAISRDSRLLITSATAVQQLPDELGRGHDVPDRPRGGHQVVEVPASQGGRIAHQNDQPPRARNGNVESLFQSQKTDVAPPIGAHQRQHDNVLFSALESIDRIDLELPLRWPVVRPHESPQQVALLGVRRDHTDRQVGRSLRRQMASDRSDQS